MEPPETFWDLIKKYEIEIPTLQRDYAQGRESEKEIAIDFVESLYNALCTNNSPISLDFIYGKVENYVKVKNEKLIPVDGQQRLTTLWLLHWYIATKEGCINDGVKDKLLRFTYKTRLKSPDFCKYLIEKGIDQLDNSKNISERIRDQNWYRLTWEQDPTVKNMLNMLDIIHKKFKETTNLWELLIEKRLITFHFLEMKNLALTDELYIKMNARGKPLSKFEYFKAKFAELLGDNKYKLDTDWLNNIFWKNYSHKAKVKSKEILDIIEEYFYNFFENLSLLLYTENSNVNNFYTENFDYFNLLSFFNQELKQRQEERVVFTKSNVSRITKYLDYFENDLNDEIKRIYFDNFIESHAKINYWDRARFYSLLLCVDYIKNDSDVKKQWLRITKNLINNTRIEEPEEFFRAIKSLKKLSQNIVNLSENLSENKIDVDFFYGEQVEEEKLKCRLILGDNDNYEKKWEDLIIEAENFSYFDGQIGFLLEMSKDNNGNYNKQSFEKYFDALKVIFEKLKGHPEFLFERALLTRGDYFVRKGSNYTFCNYNEGLRDKMDNWRKVFNDQEKRNMLKDLLDNIKNINDIENEVKEIIDSYLEQNEKPKDWRYFFIKNGPNLMEYCQKRQIRCDDLNDKFPWIRLLSKERIYGEHAELYTYNLFLYLKNQMVHNIDIEYEYSYYSDGTCKIKIKNRNLEISYNSESHKLSLQGKEYEVYDIKSILDAIQSYKSIENSEDIKNSQSL